MKKIIVAAALLALGATAAFAGPIEDRQASMKAIAAAAKDASTAAKATPYDAATVKAKLQVIADAADKFPTLFPKGTEAGGATKTGAGPAIWTDAAGFKAAAAKLSTDAKAAGAAASADAFTAAFKTVQADCGACHKTYRVSAN
jgi:cytochrome c556